MDKGLFKRKGKILIAVNEWLTFYNVRVNQLSLITGREILLKIKPTQHTASQSVKSLPIESRKCRLTTENHVNNKLLKQLIYSKQDILGTRQYVHFLQTEGVLI